MLTSLHITSLRCVITFSSILEPAAIFSIPPQTLQKEHSSSSIRFRTRQLGRSLDSLLKQPGPGSSWGSATPAAEKGDTKTGRTNLENLSAHGSSSSRQILRESPENGPPGHVRWWRGVAVVLLHVFEGNYILCRLR